MYLIFLVKKKVINVDKNIQPISAIKYAKGFDIINDNGVKKLIIKAAYQNSDEVFEYEIHKNATSKGKYLNINIPIKK